MDNVELKVRKVKQVLQAVLLARSMKLYFACLLDIDKGIAFKIWEFPIYLINFDVLSLIIAISFRTESLESPYLGINFSGWYILVFFFLWINFLRNCITTALYD